MDGNISINVNEDCQTTKSNEYIKNVRISRAEGEYFHQCVTILCTLWLLDRKIYIASLIGKGMFVKRQTPPPCLGLDHRRGKDLL